MIIGHLTISLDEVWQVGVMVLLLLSLLLTTKSIYQRLMPEKSSRFITVLLLNVVATLSIISLVIKPSWQSDKVQSATLLTSISASFEQGDIEKLQALADTGNVYQLAQSSPEHQNLNLQSNIQHPPQLESILKKIPSLKTAEQLLIKHPNLRALSLYGDGLDTEQLHAFKQIPLTFAPRSMQSGLREVSWSQHLILGQSLTINGQYQSNEKSIVSPPQRSTVQLKLLDMAGQTVAETELSNKEHFQLFTQPKVPGRYLYQLILSHSDGDIIEQQDVAVFVDTAPAVKITIIQSAPSFESKHLANWAAENSAQVIIHSQISRDKFISKQLNSADDSAVTLSPELLAEQDFLLIDGRALLSLSQRHTLWLNQAIAQGLGVLVLTDNTLIKGFETSPPPLLNTFKLTTDSKVLDDVFPRWKNTFLQEHISPIGLPIFPAKISASTSSILLADENDALSLYIQSGMGKIALSILRERFRWLTNGDRQTYSLYWQHVLSTLGRPSQTLKIISPRYGSAKRINHAQQRCLITNKSELNIEVTNGDSQQKSQLALNQHQLFKEQQCAFYWPQSNGWHELSVRSQADDKVFSSKFEYIYSEQQWQTDQQHRKIQATHNFISQQQQMAKTARPDTLRTPQTNTINPLWFWWLLIISASLLWLETKFE